MDFLPKACPETGTVVFTAALFVTEKAWETIPRAGVKKGMCWKCVQPRKRQVCIGSYRKIAKTQD